MSFRILTVGDGDLSCSVALKRAYGAQIHLLATTVLSQQELLTTYPETAEANIQELGSHTVKYEIDATLLHKQLSIKSDDLYDVILFHHPHLGVYWEDELEHIQQHMTLLSHYLDSARRLLKQPDGCVHVCLCGHQAETWKLVDICTRLGLHVSQTVPASRPLYPHLQANVPDTAIKAPRRYRNGKLGSKHWLSNYGYRHQLTFPQSGHDSRTMNVSVSTHYFLQPMTAIAARELAAEHVMDERTCSICARTFESMEQLMEHWRNPARPPKALPVDAPLDDNHNCIVKTQNMHLHGEGEAVAACDPSPTDSSSVVVISDDLSRRQFTVEHHHNGKRLRWFLQHVAVLGSKRKCEQIIQSGSVLVRGQVATDSSRILASQDIIHVVDVSRTTGSLDSQAAIRHVATWSKNCVIVWKPVRMRTAGMFDPMSLESVYSWQASNHYTPMTKLDRGCSGLVMMRKQTFSDCDDVSSVLGFTALVHGEAPDSWFQGVTVDLRIDTVRRWKRLSSEASSHKEATSTMKILLVEKADRPPLLSTIHVTTSSDISGVTSAICSCLRKQFNLPVVGDRFASEEYLTLPRPVRQRIKNRLCIGCTEISRPDDQFFPVKEEPHQYWRASFWQDFMRLSKSAGNS